MIAYKIKDLAQKFNVNASTIRTYIGRAEFNKIKRVHLKKGVFMYHLNQADLELLEKRLSRNFL